MYRWFRVVEQTTCLSHTKSRLTISLDLTLRPSEGSSLVQTSNKSTHHSFRFRSRQLGTQILQVRRVCVESTVLRFSCFLGGRELVGLLCARGEREGERSR